MNDWKEYKLGELYNVSSGISKAREEFGFGETFISYKNVFNNYFLPDTPKELVNLTEQEQNKCSVSEGDIFLTRTSEDLEEVGMSSFELKDYPMATFNDFCRRLRIKENSPIKVDSAFIGYLLRERYIRKGLLNMLQ